MIPINRCISPPRTKTIEPDIPALNPRAATRFISKKYITIVMMIVANIEAQRADEK